MTTTDDAQRRAMIAELEAELAKARLKADQLQTWALELARTARTFAHERDAARAERNESRGNFQALNLRLMEVQAQLTAVEQARDAALAEVEKLRAGREVEP